MDQSWSRWIQSPGWVQAEGGWVQREARWVQSVPRWVQKRVRKVSDFLGYHVPREIED